MSAESQSNYTPLPPFTVDRGGLQYNHTQISMDQGPGHPSNKRGGEGAGGNDPFSVSLIIDPPTSAPVDSPTEPPVFPGTYKVVVGWGYICERMSDSGAPLTYYYPTGIGDELAILVNETVCVKVHVKAGGSIGEEDPPSSPPEDAVFIVVMPNASIVNLAPTDSAAGYYYYKLAGLVPGENPGTDPPTFTKWLTGSHLEHFVGGGESTPPEPLTIIQGSAANKFQIVPGYVNTLMPTLSGTALNAGTAPEITVSANKWVWVKCVGTFGDPDSYVVTIETSTSGSVPAGTEITAYGFVSFRLIGSVGFAAGTPPDPDTFEITNMHSGGNLGVESFGNINLWWIA